ncbi:MAG: hypothetical protein MSIBF_02980 [Candidatus Altiarchaeales archaeon IMC4]|nr:MAG: hypothetical protein MSIBF_02980 [Candidatus Altiarchaeales archaeon IMC4]
MNKKLLILFAFAVAVLIAGMYVKDEWNESAPKPQKIILGKSYILVPKNAVVGVQVDRVIRDVEWVGVWDEKKVPANYTPRDTNEVVPYMEGARTIELMNYANVTVVSLTPAVCKEDSLGRCYTKDGEGNYRFYMPPDKIRRTAIKTDGGYILHDTHGVNMVAEQAAKKKPFLVIACGDMPSKAEASLYLANMGINVYTPCDRFQYLNLDYQAKGRIIGTAPIRNHSTGAIIGNQSVEIDMGEKIVVQWTDKPYPDQYCDTPWRYFTALEDKYNLKLDLIRTHADTGESYKVVQKAMGENAKVIGVRIHDENDSEPVKKWLSEDKDNRAILFHSAPYVEGYKLFFDFPNQTSFGDLKPEFIY